MDLALGQPDPATRSHQQALALCRQTGDRAAEAEALNGLGEIVLARHQLDEARTHHTAALGVATQTGEKYQQARAHRGLALVLHAQGDPASARGHWRQALAHYTFLGVPEAQQIPVELGTSSRGGDPAPTAQ